MYSFAVGLITESPLINAYMGKRIQLFKLVILYGAFLVFHSSHETTVCYDVAIYNDANNKFTNFVR